MKSILSFFHKQCEKSKSLLHKISSWRLFGDRNNVAKRYLIPFFIVAILLIILPVIILIFYSLIVSSGNGLIFQFTFENLLLLFTNSDYFHIFLLTMFMALMATVSCLIIGYPVAYILNFHIKKKKTNYLLIFTMPIWLNMLLRTLGLKSLIGLIAPQLSGTTFLMIWGMTVLYLPFMILSVFNVLDRISNSYIEASYDLGANRVQTFRKIILPMSFPGILNGCLLVFLPAMTTLIVPQFLGNGAEVTISKIIENYFLNGSNFPAAAGISVIVCLISYILWMLMKMLERKSVFIFGKKHHKNKLQMEGVNEK